jgi:3D (Asp-Asp-Asp) domain-containing protein
MLSCTPIALAKSTNKADVIDKSKYTQVYTARITYYSTDSKWGNRVACQRSKRAKEGVSVAAHPNFKFGTKLYIPQLKGKIGNGNFIVQDRGGAVTSKKASRGKAYVFDIYVTSHSKIRKHAYSQPEYMKVYVQKP